MGIPTRDELLRASDIETREVNLPSLGFDVRIRSLPAAYSNAAQTEGTQLLNVENDKGRLEQTVRIDHEKLEALKVLHGLVEPKLNSVEDAYTFSQQITTGAWKKLVNEIDKVSGLDVEAVEHTEALFRDSGSGEERRPEPDAAGKGNGRPAVPVRTGA